MADKGVKITTIDPVSVADDIIVLREGSAVRQSFVNLSNQMAGSGAVATRLSRAETMGGYGAIYVVGRADLDDVSEPKDKQGAWVLTTTEAGEKGIWSYSVADTDWVRIGDLPISMSLLTEVGGTANAITAKTLTSPEPSDIRALLLVPRYDNDDAVTIALDDNDPIPLLSAGGGDLTEGSLVAGVPTMILSDGTNLRITFPADVVTRVEALADAAEQAKLDAEVARAAAEAAAGALVVTRFSSKSSLEVALVSALTKSAELVGYYSAGDGGGGLYRRVDAEPSHAGKVRSTDRYLSDGTEDVTNGGWWVLAETTVNPFMFDAPFDPSVDATSAVVNMLGYPAKIFDGLGQTYKLTSTIAADVEKCKIRNFNFDTSETSGAVEFLAFEGAQGAQIALTADTPAGSATVTISDTSAFVADGYAWFESTDQFDALAGTTYGQIVRVKSVDSSSQLTLYEEVDLDYTTSASAAISPLSFRKNIVLENVHFVGANDISNNQTALKFNKCMGVRAKNVTTKYYSYAGIQIDRCIDVGIAKPSTKYARKTGLAYGVAIVNGCDSVNVTNGYSEDTRHFVTIGGVSGINSGISVTGCHIKSSRDAGLDSHPSCNRVIFSNNTIEVVDGVSDGIICQGSHAQISNNTIVGNCSNGVRVQPCVSAVASQYSISGNITNRGGNLGGTDVGVYLDCSVSGNAGVASCKISGNTLSGTYEYGVYVFASSADVENLIISNNIEENDAATYGIYLRSNAGRKIDTFAINGNLSKTSGGRNVYLSSADGAGILNGSIEGNTLVGGLYSISMTNCSNVVAGPNYASFTTRKYSITACSDLALDRSQSTIVTATNSTYAVTDDDISIVGNRAATITVTLPDPAAWAGRELNIKTIQAQAVLSDTSNVVPIDSVAAGTAIVPATAGSWCQLKSDGTNWIAMQAA